jgi:hypothetical protein
MEQSEKEKAFEKEYEQLLKKYDVYLLLETYNDEWGDHSELSFREKGKYCNINYSPDFQERNRGRCGMGG